VPEHEQLDVFHVQAAPATNERAQQSPDGEIEEGESHATEILSTRSPRACDIDIGALQGRITPAGLTGRTPYECFRTRMARKTASWILRR
jgi:hypothetical protein